MGGGGIGGGGIRGGGGGGMGGGRVDGRARRLKLLLERLLPLLLLRLQRRGRPLLLRSFLLPL